MSESENDGPDQVSENQQQIESGTESGDNAELSKENGLNGADSEEDQSEDDGDTEKETSPAEDDSKVDISVKVDIGNDDDLDRESDDSESDEDVKDEDEDEDTSESELSKAFSKHRKGSLGYASGDSTPRTARFRTKKLKRTGTNYDLMEKDTAEAQNELQQALSRARKLSESLSDAYAEQDRVKNAPVEKLADSSNSIPEVAYSSEEEDTVSALHRLDSNDLDGKMSKIRTTVYVGEGDTTPLGSGRWTPRTPRTPSVPSTPKEPVGPTELQMRLQKARSLQEIAIKEHEKELAEKKEQQKEERRRRLEEQRKHYEEKRAREKAAKEAKTQKMKARQRQKQIEMQRAISTRRMEQDKRWKIEQARRLEEERIEKMQRADRMKQEAILAGVNVDEIEKQFLLKQLAELQRKEEEAQARRAKIEARWARLEKQLAEEKAETERMLYEEQQEKEQREQEERLRKIREAQDRLKELGYDAAEDKKIREQLKKKTEAEEKEREEEERRKEEEERLLQEEEEERERQEEEELLQKEEEERLEQERLEREEEERQQREEEEERLRQEEEERRLEEERKQRILDEERQKEEEARQKEKEELLKKDAEEKEKANKETEEERRKKQMEEDEERKRLEAESEEERQQREEHERWLKTREGKAWAHRQRIRGEQADYQSKIKEKQRLAGVHTAKIAEKTRQEQEHKYQTFITVASDGATFLKFARKKRAIKKFHDVELFLTKEGTDHYLQWGKKSIKVTSHGFSATQSPSKENVKQKRIKNNLDKFFAIRIEELETDEESELCLLAKNRAERDLWVFGLNKLSEGLRQKVERTLSQKHLAGVSIKGGTVKKKKG